MKRKPTLKQLKERPALWIDLTKIGDEEMGCLHITHPSGKNERYLISVFTGSHLGWVGDTLWTTEHVHKDKDMNFLGWL